MLKQSLSILAILAMTHSGIAQEVPQQRVTPTRKNTPEQMKKPYLILISADGFRYDYAEKYKAANLLKLSGAGVKAESMYPVFPAATQANHFALITGMYPAHSGIVGNAFYDPTRNEMFKGNDGSWFKNNPIWVSAEKQGMLTASLNFIDSRPAIDGVQTSYFFQHTKKNPTTADERVAIIKSWLELPEDVRPHLIALYNSETDHAGHLHGPDSKEVSDAVAFVDSVIGKLQVVIEESKLPVNVVFVSDHGMTPIDREHILKIPASIDTSKFVVVDQGAHVSLHARNQADVMPMYKQLKAENAEGYKVFLKKDMRKDLVFDAKEDRHHRIGDIILMSEWPRIFSKGKPTGAHGFNPYEVKDVHATFFAWGPAFKEHQTIKAFPNVEVYGVMTNVLGIKPEPNDGKGELAKTILK